MFILRIENGHEIVFVEKVQSDKYGCKVVWKCSEENKMGIMEKITTQILLQQ